MAVIGLAISYAAAGLKGAEGFGMAIVLFPVFLFGTWGLAQAFTPQAKWTPIGRLAVFVLFLKIPLIGLAYLALQRVGGPGPVSFLVGGALVYCLAVGRVLARPNP